MINCDRIADLIEDGSRNVAGGISVVPLPDTDAIRKSGEASVTLRLGRWFISLRQSSQQAFDVSGPSGPDAEQRSAKSYYAPFGEEFTLHPGRFVLAATLEWIKLPNDVGGYVTGKSTWARRGLIIETAAGVHPGFNGCLTLELTNVGEVPIVIRPGMTMCQVFFHSVEGGTISSMGPLTGRRRPYLGVPKPDPILQKLREAAEASRKDGGN